jgi:hypothetical protein
MEDFKRNKNDSLSWKIPQAVIESACQKLIDKGKTIIPRFLPLILIIEYALYVYLKIVLPDEMELGSDLLKIFFYIFLATAGILLVQYVIYPRILRRLKKSRTITKKYFQWSDKQIYWKRIQGYWIENNEEFPELLNITFKSKRRLYSIYLPEDEQYHPEIIEFIDSCVPQIEPGFAEPVFTLTKRQVVFCWSFTIAVSIIAAILFIFFLPFQYLFYFMLATFFIGPGTLSMIFISGKKFYKDRRSLLAFAINMAAFMLIMTIVVLVELYKYHKIIESAN